MVAKWLYRTLLRLYPADYLESFASEMTTVFEKAWAEHRQQGFVSTACFAVPEFAGLIAGAGAEWFAKFTTERSVRVRSLSESRLAPAVASCQGEFPPDLAQAQQRVAILVERIVHAIANHDFEAARRYSYEEYREREQLNVLKQNYGM